MQNKALAIGSVSVATAMLAVGAFFLGMKIMESKQKAQESTAELVQEASVTNAEPIKTTVTEKAESTTVTEAVTTIEETTEATTVTTAPKPTISNAYVYYINTGVGVKLYVHADGDFAYYQYLPYYKLFNESDFSPGDKGESKEHEVLAADGLGGGIESYKALITAWNADKSQSVEQWAYMDEDRCDDGSVHPPKNPVYLFGGNPANVKNSISLRRKPNAQAAVITEIPVGAQIGIYSCDVSGWYWAEYGEFKGYVNAKYIKEIEHYDPDAYGVPDGHSGGGNKTGYIQAAGGETAILDYPSEMGGAYGFIPNGAAVEIVQSDGAWLEIYYDGMHGYVRSSDVRQ